MENATKRIRKARRQGLASRGPRTAPRTRLETSRPADIAQTPRANRPRQTRVATRKAKRQAERAPRR